MRDVTGIDPTRTILMEVGDLTDEQHAVLACHPLYAAGRIELQPLGRWAVVFWASDDLSTEGSTTKCAAGSPLKEVRRGARLGDRPRRARLPAARRRPVRDSGVVTTCAGYRAAMRTVGVIKKGARWVGQTDGRTATRSATRAEAVKAATDLAKKGKEPTSVRIHKTDGEFQQERTFPRSADPRRSKG